MQTSIESQKRVLIVDDEQDFVTSLEDILQSWYYTTDRAHDCRTALKIFQASDTPVVLIDIKLGNESGLTLLENIKKVNPKSICIMMTAYNDIATVMSTLKLGANDYLNKPISPPLLLETLKRGFEKIQLEKENAELQMQLQQKQKVEALGTLAGGIAHDINNILAIRNAKTTAKTSENSTEAEALNKNLDQILKASHRAAGVVSQILSFSRHEDQKLEIIDLVSVVNESLDLMRSILPRTISLDRQLDTGIGRVEADPTQIHQIIMNLFTNSSQSMKEVGEIIVKLETIESAESLFRHEPDQGGRDYVRLTVTDNGAGMSEDLASRIFEPFFTTKEFGTGTGIGLSVVHNIVTSHSAKVSVESEPGVGTKIFIDFPVFQADVAGQVTEGTTDQPSENEKLENYRIGNGEKILFVDDESDITKLGKEMLQILGYRVVTATNSGSALSIFSASPDEFDLLITDLSMPQFSGLELAEEIRRIRPQLPVIICSGCQSSEDERLVAELNIFTFCIKPLLMEEYSRVVPAALNKIN